MIKNWDFGVNDYGYSSILFIEKIPVHCFLLDKIASIISKIFSNNIKIPKYLSKKLIIILKDYEDEEVIYLSDIIYSYICQPIWEYYYKKVENIPIVLPFYYVLETCPDELHLDCYDYPEIKELQLELKSTLNNYEKEKRDKFRKCAFKQYNLFKKIEELENQKKELKFVE